MTRVTADDSLRSKLGNFSVPVDICDENGKVLARVVPSANASEYLFEEPVFDEAELSRQEESGIWYSTEQVLEHLRGLEQRLRCDGKESRCRDLPMLGLPLARKNGDTL